VVFSQDSEAPLLGKEATPPAAPPSRLLLLLLLGAVLLLGAEDEAIFTHCVLFSVKL
jgi:hypothetical protein